MTIVTSKFRHILVAAGAVALGACEVPAADDDQNKLAQPDTLSETENSDEEKSIDQSLQTALLETHPAPNGYALEWNTQLNVCNGALIALNTAHAQRDEQSKSEASLDYASAQAAQYLKTEQNIQWRAETISAAEPAITEIATFNFFNDGIERRVVRMQGNLAGNKLVTLGVLESGDTELVRLNFGHAGITSEGLPDTENLHSKLTYSVSDVINIDQGYHTLLMPLEDFDSSGRIYLASWKTKEGTTPPRHASDYYASLTCVFVPTNTTMRSASK